MLDECVLSTLHRGGEGQNVYRMIFFPTLVTKVVGHLIGVKKQCKFCRYVKCSQWKGEFWIQEVIRARLDTCLRLSTIDEVVSRCCKLRNCKTGE